METQVQFAKYTPDYMSHALFALYSQAIDERSADTDHVGAESKRFGYIRAAAYPAVKHNFCLVTDGGGNIREDIE